ncbi:sulfotransferase [Falsihalocynthiibacter sp. BN13B15]|uniref:sulfotransferase family protein n=1 Tax=Falsihalocynthiibacter sp. BN13B15 TaxID=3240871 RepID=UPI0035105C01
MTTANTSHTIIFVGGAPRSGTTITHQLLCTSELTNKYIPEPLFLRSIVDSYYLGVENWAKHTNPFFAENEHFRAHLAGHLLASINHISNTVKNPPILTLKDPLLTPGFPALRYLCQPHAKFVTVIRHPYHVVRSRQEVMHKMNLPFDAQSVHALATEYMSTYQHIDKDPYLSEVEYYFKYEDLIAPNTIEELRQFTGLSDISVEKIGVNETFLDDAWFSPKYGSKLDTLNRLDPLAPEFRKIVREICAPIMERFDYRDDI